MVIVCKKLAGAIFVCCIWAFSNSLYAQIQVAPDRFRIEFTDKNHNSYSISQPELFLSQRALQRRARQGIEVDYNDLPVSYFYIDSLKRMGFEVLNTSRWFNSATLRTTAQEIEKLQNVDFIKYTGLVEIEQIENEETEELDFASFLRFLIENDLLNLDDLFETDEDEEDVDEDDNEYFELHYEDAPAHYGKAAAQIGMLNGQNLHERGFRGNGMFIGVIDGGFFNVNELSGFENMRASGRLRGIVNFTPDVENPLGNNNHGTNVLSILAADLPDQLIGSAPDAEYILLRSEEVEHEYLVEEDNWIVAIEYADSIGVDVINCSLGYTTFDDSSQNHCKTSIDGRSVRTSRAATMAAARGMILCISAGNDGDSNWGIISVPADADSIVAVGAVNPKGRRASFSSTGPTADNRIKPDLMAVGARTAYQNSRGSVVSGNGTSYSAPLIAGLIACLWQVYPNLTNIEIIKMVKRSSTHYNMPNIQYGYGIPDFLKLLE